MISSKPVKRKQVTIKFYVEYHENDKCEGELIENNSEEQFVLSLSKNILKNSYKYLIYANRMNNNEWKITTSERNGIPANIKGGITRFGRLYYEGTWIEEGTTYTFTIQG